MTKPPLSLYVHWPFCEAKCPYCDFNSHVRERVDANAYELALVMELDYFSGYTEGKPLSSIFFGGGTPSLMPPETVEAILSQAKQTFGFEDDIEITLEANPGSSEARKFEAFRHAGVNRLSLGIQSFDDEALKFLGRVHNAGEAMAALEMAKNIFPRISFDLIYARPDQTQGAWGKELEKAISLSKGHLSLYQLTLEKDTAFYRQHRRGLLHLPCEDTGADLYQLTNVLCADAGLPAYEVSNYAAPGFEGRHNLNYWTGGQYIGIGPGAHGRLSRDSWLVTSTEKSPEAWLARVKTKGHGLDEWRKINSQERAQEIVLTGLRLFSGIEKETFKTRTGFSLFEILKKKGFDAYKDAGLAFETETHAGLSEKGILLLDSLLVDLV